MRFDHLRDTCMQNAFKKQHHHFHHLMGKVNVFSFYRPFPAHLCLLFLQFFTSSCSLPFLSFQSMPNHNFLFFFPFLHLFIFALQGSGSLSLYKLESKTFWTFIPFTIPHGQTLYFNLQIGLSRAHFFHF